MLGGKQKESLLCSARQSRSDSLSIATAEADNRLHSITDGGSGQDARRHVLDQLDHRIDHDELKRWFVANHGRFPGTATIAFFEAASVWIEKAYRAGINGLPLSKVIPWFKSKN